MANDVLKKPVHKVILQPTKLQKLAEENKLPEKKFVKALPEKPKVQAEPKTGLASRIPKHQLPVFNIQKSTIRGAKVSLVHKSIPPLPEDKKPPCETCRTSACCSSFLVPLTQDEYESGIYGEFAVKFTKQELDQLKGKLNLIMSLRLPVRAPGSSDDTYYYLEGAIGESCPYLRKDGKCGIYEQRPVTCRTYTCVGDNRITEDMRDGTVNIEEAMTARIIGNAKRGSRD